MLKSVAPVPAALGLLGVSAIGWAIWRRGRLSSGPERRNWTDLVIGHRGCRFVDGIIENTMPAYEYALAKGADGIEIDVRLCKSGELVVYHDAVTTSQANGPQRTILDMTFAEVQALTYKKSKDANLHPPLLKEVFDLCRKHNTKLLLEIKHYSWFNIDLVLKQLKPFLSGPHAQFFYDNVTIISFNPYLCYRCRVMDPKLAVCPLYDDATVSAIAYASCDCEPYWPLRLFAPYLLDRLFFWGCDRLAAGYMGASMVGTRLNLCPRSMTVRHAEQGRLVYLWGLGKQLPLHLHDTKVFGSCDDDHDMLRKDFRNRQPSART